jgi:hypothetical protein
MITKINALQSLRPGAQWSMSNDAIIWHDTEQGQPTDAEIEAELARLTALEPARIATENRRAAYAAESDPLFYKAQRGEATMEEWQAKVAEIKSRYPKE